MHKKKKEVRSVVCEFRYCNDTYRVVNSKNTKRETYEMDRLDRNSMMERVWVKVPHDETFNTSVVAMAFSAVIKNAT